MQKQKTFKWAGREFTIESARVGEVKEFFGLQKRLAEIVRTTPDDVGAQLEIAESILRLFGCPDEVIADLCFDELLECLSALIAAQLGSGGDGGNPEARAG